MAEILRALATNKASRIAAAWQADWELYKILSQEHVALKKLSTRYHGCPVCGAIIKRQSTHCHLHSNLHQFYPHTLPARMTPMP